MNQNISEKQRTLRFKTPIILLSLISLLFAILSCITYFVDNKREYNYSYSSYELAFSFPSIFELISLLIRIAPYVLLVIYLLKFHNKTKATILVPITFGLIAFTSIYHFIKSFIYGYDIYFRTLIFDIAIIIAFTLATINALKGFTKVVYLIIAIVVGLHVEFISIINILQSIDVYLEQGLYLYLFTWLIGNFGTIIFYIALLLFGLNNRIPSILSVPPEKEKKNAEKTNPEEALKLLKEKVELGLITDDEYQAQRADIISKL